MNKNFSTIIELQQNKLDEPPRRINPDHQPPLRIFFLV